MDACSQASPEAGTATGISDAIPSAFDERRWIRERALDLALKDNQQSSTENILERAQKFEAYLTGASADVDPERIARISHEVNRAWCQFTGDTSQEVWAKAPAWQRDSAIAGVKFHFANPDAADSASHDEWMREKIAGGWTYGPDKNPAEKKHPCLVPFEALPPEQQFKDRLFRTIVHAARSA